MILDKALEFDPSGTALTVTAVSTNVVDLVNPREMGIGNASGATPKITVLVNTALLSAGATTLQVQVMGSTDNVTYSVYAESRALGKAVLIPANNGVFDIDMPERAPGDVLPRYLKLNYIVATGPFTGGTIAAYLSLTRDDQVYYPPGIVVAN